MKPFRIPEESSGGPVKPFLDHLEDLRWVTIRCFAALLVCMTVALVGANHFTAALMRPIEQAAEELARQGADDQDPPRIITAKFGDHPIQLTLGETSFKQLRADSSGDSKPIPLRFEARMSEEGLRLTAVVEGAPRSTVPRLEHRSPMTPFMIAMKTAFYGGAAMALPIVALNIGAFLFPALTCGERRLTAWVIGAAMVMFVLGGAFAYFVMAKIILLASISFSNWLGFAPTIWFIDNYAGYLLKLVFGVGLAFQLPVALLTMARLGMTDCQGLIRFRPYWVAINLLVSALLTPQDILSQLLLALPLQALFELSVLVAWIWEKSRSSFGITSNPDSGGTRRELPTQPPCP